MRVAPLPQRRERRRDDELVLLLDELTAGVRWPGTSGASLVADAEAVGRILQDPDTHISLSDAGAHLQMMCGAGDTTLLLTRHVRDRPDLSLEEAVHQLTGRPAAGSIDAGCHDEAFWARSAPAGLQFLGRQLDVA